MGIRLATIESFQWLLTHGIVLLASLAAGFAGRAVPRYYRWLRARHRREQALEAAVRERTEELERERLRERARSAILEQLLASQSLGAVLDSIARYVAAEIPACRIAILLRRPKQSCVATAPDLDPEWVNRLVRPHILPPTSWLRDGDWDRPAETSDWHEFLEGLRGAVPQAIHSRVIASAESTLGVLLAFQLEPVAIAIDRDIVLQSAAQLAFIAVEHRQYCDDLRHRAFHDTLTGLPNRTLFEERLSATVLEAEASRQGFAVLSIDLDRFKNVNDALGPRGADTVLGELACRIKGATRPEDTVARTGGDEFMVIVGGLGSGGTVRACEVEEISAQILDAIRQPMLIKGVAVTVTATLGSSVYPADSGDPEGLRRRAEAALSCAKGRGRNRSQAFAVTIEALDRVRIEEMIRHALKAEAFSVHYQPKMGADGSFCGLEALIRLSTARGGTVSPAALIAVAEESGLIMQVGAWVLSEVCRQMRSWHAAHLGWIPVAVNVSPLQISRPQFGSEVRSCLISYGVPAHALELELTESVVLGGGEEAERQMRDLRSIGIRFSIDDFGTGYSSLSYLYLLPVDAIKLDRSFVQAIGTDAGARRLVQAMIGVAEGLGLDVVAEGVETEEQRSILIEAGCPVMQGYLFARPGSAAEIERFFAPGTWSRQAGQAEDVDSESNTHDLLRIAEALAEPSVHAV